MKPKIKSRFGLFIEKKSSILKESEKLSRMPNLDNEKHKSEILDLIEGEKKSSLKVVLHSSESEIYDKSFKLSFPEIGANPHLDESILIDEIENKEITMNNNHSNTKKEDKRSSSLELFFNLDQHIMPDSNLNLYSLSP